MENDQLGSSVRERAQTQLIERQKQMPPFGRAAGKPNKAICRELDIEEGTVKAHIATIFRVLDVSNAPKRPASRGLAAELEFAAAAAS